jgi:hypothetical protein
MRSTPPRPPDRTSTRTLVGMHARRLPSARGPARRVRRRRGLRWATRCPASCLSVRSRAPTTSRSTRPEFRFSSPIDPSSVGPESIQVREAPRSRNAPGRFVVSADRVFELALPGCATSDAGPAGGVPRRSSAIPETSAIRNLAGDPLAATVVASFHTLPDTSPDLFRDHVPGSAPYLVASSPEDGANPLSPSPIVDAVRVRPGNAVVLDFSENLDPCSITEDSIHLAEYEVGDPTLGFVPAFDSTPQDPYVWGGGTVLATPARIRCAVTLEQTPLRTRVTLRPVFDRFPDNALLVATITNGVRDLVGAACLPATVAFVTENSPRGPPRRPWSSAHRAISSCLSTSPPPTWPRPDSQGWPSSRGAATTARTSTRCPGRRGLDLIGCAPRPRPTTPALTTQPATDVILSSAPPNACINQIDGSMAVVPGVPVLPAQRRHGADHGHKPVIFPVSGDVPSRGGGLPRARRTWDRPKAQVRAPSMRRHASTRADGVAGAAPGRPGSMRLATFGDGSRGVAARRWAPAGSGGPGVHVGPRGAAPRRPSLPNPAPTTATASAAAEAARSWERRGLGTGHPLARQRGPGRRRTTRPRRRGRVRGGGGGSIRPTSWNTAASAGEAAAVRAAVADHGRGRV